MKSENNRETPTLRQKAEKLLKMRSLPTLSELPVDEIQRLVMELEINRIELELQNEALILAKEQTELSVEKYAELYDFAPTGYFALSRHGEILEANLYGSQMLDRERFHLISARFGFFVSDETRPQFNHFLDKVFTGKTSETCEVTLLTERGNRLFVQLNAIHATKQDQCLLTVADISRIKQAEASLVASENEHRNNFIFLHSILESPTSIIIFSLDSNYCYTAFTKFHQQTMKKLWGVEIQNGMNMLDVISNADDREKAKRNFDRAVAGENFILSEEYGDEKLSRSFYENYYSPLKDSDGKIIGLSVFVIDITERKKAEMNTIRLNILYSIRSEINKTIARVKEPDELFENICRITIEYGQFRMSWIGLIDQSKKLVTPTHIAGLEQGYLSNIRISYLDNELGQGPTGTSIREGRCIICQNISTDKRMLPWREKALNCGFLSSASVPFRRDRNIVGALTVYSEKPYGFDKESENLLNEIGNDISFALDAMDAAKRRDKAEDELRESNRRTERIIEAGQIGTWEWNIQTGESKLNEECAKIIGYSPDELEPFNVETIMAFADPDDLKRSLELLRRHFSGELPYYDCEGKIKHKDGHWVWVHDRGQIISHTSDGKPLLMFGTHMDISARKKAEEEILESEEKYRSLFSTDKNALILIDKESFDIIEVNDAACLLFGYSKEELLRLKIIDLSAEPEKSKQAIAEMTSRVELRYYKKKDGTVFPVDISSSRFSLRNRSMIFGSIRDITEREANSLDIKHKSEELQRLNNEKDKFFSIISHDLRAPFNGFLGLTEMMAEGLSHMTLEEIQSLAVMMKESASNLYRLLGNLLEWSQMQRGLISFAPQPFLLTLKIAESIVNSVESARKKEIDFRLDIPTGLSVVADIHMFESIIRNLSDNAVKFTCKGGRVTISAKPLSEESVEISIRDTGIGMAPEMIDNLFSLDIITNRKGTENEPSSGLGLILCKDFIQRHGSQLQVTSKVGKGSTFSFTLPSSSVTTP